MHETERRLLLRSVSVVVTSCPADSFAQWLGRSAGLRCCEPELHVDGGPDFRVDFGAGDKKPPNPYTALSGSSPFLVLTALFLRSPAVGRDPLVGSGYGGDGAARVVTCGGGVDAIATNCDVVGTPHGRGGWKA